MACNLPTPECAGKQDDSANISKSTPEVSTRCNMPQEGRLSSTANQDGGRNLQPPSEGIVFKPKEVAAGLPVKESGDSCPNTHREGFENNMAAQNGGNAVKSPPDDTKEGTRRNSGVTKAPDGGYGWVIMIASFFMSVIIDGVCFSFGIFYLEFLDFFGESASKTSMVGSVLNGMYLFIGPIVGALTNRFGCRQVAITGSVLSCIAYFLSTFSTNIDVLIVLYGALGGFGFGLMYLPAIVMVGFYFEKRRAFATGVAVCGSGIGAFVFAPLCEKLLTVYSWKGATWIIAGIALNGVVLGSLFRPLEEMKTKKDKNKSGDKTNDNREITVVPDVNEKVLDCDKNKMYLKGNDAEEQTANQESALRDDNGNRKFSFTSGRQLKRSFSSISYKRKPNPPEARSSKELSNPRSPQKCRSSSFDDIRNIQTGTRTGSDFPDDTSDHSKDSGYQGEVFYINLEKSSSVSSTSSSSPNGTLVVKTNDAARDADIMTSHASDNDVTTGCFGACVRMCRDTLKLDFGLVRHPVMIVYGLSCFMCMAGFYVPFTYLPKAAIEHGISRESAAFLLSIIGIANTIGRVLCGWVSDRPWADALLINNIALMMAGVATIASPFCTEYWMFATYSAVFGLGIAVFVSLRSILVVEFLGEEKLTNAFGLVTMCQGLSAFIGAPIAGTLYDVTGSFHWSFYSAGAMLFLAGFICLPLRRIARWKERRDEKTPTSREVLEDPRDQSSGPDMQESQV